MNVKKIIAREGLSALSFILFGVLFIGADSWSILNKDFFIFKILPFDYYSIENALPKKIEAFGGFLLFGGYPIYLLIRFIFWAIKTLRAK